MEKIENKENKKEIVNFDLDKMEKDLKEEFPSSSFVKIIDENKESFVSQIEKYKGELPKKISENFLKEVSRIYWGQNSDINYKCWESIRPNGTLFSYNSDGKEIDEKEISKQWKELTYVELVTKDEIFFVDKKLNLKYMEDRFKGSEEIKTREWIEKLDNRTMTDEKWEEFKINNGIGGLDIFMDDISWNSLIDELCKNLKKTNFGHRSKE